MTKPYQIQTMKPVDKDITITNIQISIQITGLDLLKSSKPHKQILLEKLSETFPQILDEICNDK